MTVSTEKEADRLYHQASEEKYQASKRGYDIRQLLRGGHQLLHVHAFHMHMMEYWDAVETMTYPETSFAKRTRRL